MKKTLFTLTTLVAALTFTSAGCAPVYVNIPSADGSIASSDPNSQTVKKVVVSAVNALMAQQGETEKPLELLLPDGTSGPAAWNIQEELGDYVFCRAANKIILKKPSDVTEFDNVIEDPNALASTASASEDSDESVQVVNSLNLEPVTADDSIPDDADVSEEKHSEPVAQAEEKEQHAADEAAEAAPKLAKADDTDAVAHVSEDNDQEHAPDAADSDQQSQDELAEADSDQADVETTQIVYVPKYQKVKVLLSQKNHAGSEIQYQIVGIRVRGVHAEVDIYKMTNFILDQFYSIQLNAEAFSGWNVQRIHPLGVLRDKVLDNHFKKVTVDDAAAVEVLGSEHK